MARPLRALGIRSPAVGLAATLLAAAHGKAVLAPPDALRPRAAVVVAWAHETVTWGTTCVASPRPGADPVAFELPIRRELLPPGREAYDWGYDCDLNNLEFLIAPSANNDTRTVAQRRAALPPPPNGCGPHDSQPFCRRLLAAWLIALAYAFYMMAATSDRYLVPALNLLCRRAGVPNGLAAATVLALGCNTPVLFALMTATFSHPNREASHVGPGVVLGAGPFNLLFAIGASVFAVGGGLRPEPGEMVRELVSLAFAVMALFLVMEDSLVQWWEALLMVVLYTCYVGLGVLLATARQPVASSAVASTRGGGCGGVLGAFQCFRKVTANKAATSLTHGVPQPPPSAVEPPARPSHVRIGTLSASDAARSTLHATGTRLANVRQNRRTHAQSVAPEHNVGADQTPEHRAVDVPEPAGDGDAAAERRADTRAAGAADAAQLVVDVPAAPAATAARDVEAALDDAGCPERIEIVTELPPPPPDHVSWEARLAAARARRAERAARGARVYDESRGAVGPSRVAGVMLVPSRLTPRVLARAAGREWRARFFVLSDSA